MTDRRWQALSRAIPLRFFFFALKYITEVSRHSHKRLVVREQTARQPVAYPDASLPDGCLEQLTVKSS